jgi:hypothetical protein
VTLVAVALILDAVVLAYRDWRGMPANGEPPPLLPHDANDVASRPLHGLCRSSPLRTCVDRYRLGDPADPILCDLRVKGNASFRNRCPDEAAHRVPAGGLGRGVRGRAAAQCDFRAVEKLTYWKNGISWVRSVFGRRRGTRCSPIVRN